MPHKLKRLDYFFIIIGLVSLSLGVSTMLAIPTVILPGWFLVMLFGGILLLLSFAVGALAKILSNGKIHLLTATSIIIALICLTFYWKEMRPTYIIYVADDFTGEAKLFRSKLNKNQLLLNKYGVGYLSDEAYQQGFKPLVYQNGKDITKMCQNFHHGTLAFAAFDGMSFGPFSYVGFTVQGRSADTLWNDLSKVLEMRIVDTSILKN